MIGSVQTPSRLREKTRLDFKSTSALAQPSETD